MNIEAEASSPSSDAQYRYKHFQFFTFLLIKTPYELKTF